MRKTYITGGRIYRNHRFEEGDLCICDKKLITEHLPEPKEGDFRIRAKGCRVIPGFIDVHTHGAVGVDVNGAKTQDLEKVGHFFAKNGTTSFLVSVLTDTEWQTRECIRQIKGYDAKRGEGADLLGIHLEGPFLAKEYKGAMPETLLRSADPELIRTYQQLAEGRIRYITVSPEVEGVIGLIPEMKKLGIRTAMGHSGADYVSSMEAIEAGVCCSTHTFNAMKLLHQHKPAILGAVLESDIYAEMICDGRHLHPGIVRLMLKTKGYNRMIAVTDSIMAAGLPDGHYHLGVNEVVVEDGDAKLPDGTRAGSTLTQIQALQNLITYTREPVEKLLPLLTENPAEMLGIADHKGYIREGYDADLVLLDDNNQIKRVWVQGNAISE